MLKRSKQTFWCHDIMIVTDPNFSILHHVQKWKIRSCGFKFAKAKKWGPQREYIPTIIYKFSSTWICEACHKDTFEISLFLASFSKSFDFCPFSILELEYYFGGNAFKLFYYKQLHLQRNPFRIRKRKKIERISWKIVWCTPKNCSIWPCKGTCSCFSIISDKENYEIRF